MTGENHHNGPWQKDAAREMLRASGYEDGDGDEAEPEETQDIESSPVNVAQVRRMIDALVSDVDLKQKNKEEVERIRALGERIKAEVSKDGQPADYDNSVREFVRGLNKFGANRVVTGALLRRILHTSEQIDIYARSRAAEERNFQANVDQLNQGRQAWERQAAEVPRWAPSESPSPSKVSEEIKAFTSQRAADRAELDAYLAQSGGSAGSVQEPTTFEYIPVNPGKVAGMISSAVERGDSDEAIIYNLVQAGMIDNTLEAEEYVRERASQYRNAPKR